MSENAIIEYLKQGGLFALVCVILFFYRRDFLQEQQTHKDDKQILLTALQNNTEAIVKLESVVQEMNNRGRAYDYSELHRGRSVGNKTDH